MKFKYKFIFLIARKSGNKIIELVSIIRNCYLLSIFQIKFSQFVTINEKQWKVQLFRRMIDNFKPLNSSINIPIYTEIDISGINFELIPKWGADRHTDTRTRINNR